MIPLLITILVFIGLAGFLAWYFISHDHGEKEPIMALWAALGFGLLGAVAAGYLEVKLLSGELSPTGVTAVGGKLLFAAMAVGVIEEACKFLPLAFFLYRKRYFNEHTDGVIYFALAGLGFGVPENILYTMQGGVKTGIGRLILTPFFHAAVTALVGYYLAKTKLRHGSLWTVAAALGVAALIHGVYDFGAFIGGGPFLVLSFMITFAMTVMLFMFYMRASEHDQDQGLSVVGHNSFCRSCGKPNPRHYLYCQTCGQRA